MLRRTLNLGILAHVDAGKTTLTERLLYAAGVIDEIGSVDDGTTQTDSLALERQRGITIKSAVVSFAIDDVVVNLIDTPGHPDFIAEVERVLGVLDGAVLVISAVEGVQPQTQLLMRALQRLRVPTLIFVNKIDRTGADDDRTLETIEKRLTPAVIPMGAATGLGTPTAAFAPFGRLDPELARQARTGAVHPAFFGSALTGAGAAELTAGIAELLPAAAGDADGPVSGRVFKIERGPAGERVAYVRMFRGTVRVRDRLDAGKVTAIRVFADGDAVQRREVRAGEIAKLSGLDVRIGDWIGEPGPGLEHRFPPPAFEAVVVPADPTAGNRLQVALGQLAEQDPLISVRQDDERRELSVSLYGEVQKEVIQATLAADFGLDVGFLETTPICVERPSATGEAVEMLNTPTNPFHADLGLRVEPAAPDSGVEVRLDVAPRDAPLYVFKGFESFAAHMEEYVGIALERGLFGWQVVDCVVTVTKIGYSLADGPPSRRGPMPTANDVKKLTALVLAQALADGGTTACEPLAHVKLELPATAIGAVLAALGRLGGVAQAPRLTGESAVVETVLAATEVQELQRQLPGLTGGEGVLESEPAGYRPVTCAPPVRRGATG
ncbi:MAG TPA: translation factor GTPase family protein [Gaiellaceae bacterium]|nr:translation factor GTPase family protein [Gaiellaceae bacterium]